MGTLNGFTEAQLTSELESLQALRRRSLSSRDGDPELLPASGRSPPLPPSPTLVSPPTSPGEAVDLPFSHSLGPKPPSLPTEGSDSDTPLPLSDLMWLPAHLHPDVAPQEFRAFLAEQTKPEALLRRSGSLDRKRSMLSKQYTPSISDGVQPEEEPVSPTDGSARRRDPLENLTIADLQKLEQLAVQAAQAGEKGEEGKDHFHDLLRRSMSTGPTVGAGDADSQPLVQSPGGLIRRTARTKIRKSSLAGDGGGHRFGPSRRDRLRKDSDDGQVSPLERRDSVTDSDELHEEPSSTPTTPERSPTKLRSPPIEIKQPSPTLPPTLGLASPPSPSRDRTMLAPMPKPPRAPSPGTEERPFEQPPKPATPPVAPPINVAAPPPPSIASSSSSIKKSGWARLVSRGSVPKQEEEDDASDTASLASVASSASKKSQKSSVFGGFFRSKAKEEGVRDIDMPAQMMVSPTASGMLNQNGRYTNFYRLPIHVERAVYRLSHIKLANPRRPLYEQVLISNLMFWYLGVINKPVAHERPPEPTIRQVDPPLIEVVDDSPPPLAKRPERSAPPIIREPVPERRESNFEVLHRQSTSSPRKDVAGDGAWLGAWQRRSPSPVSSDESYR